MTVSRALRCGPIQSGAHALTVIRTDLPPDQLPQTNVPAVNTTDDRLEVVGFHSATEGGGFSVETQLEPGAYVLICNVGSHYARGMRTGFDVT